MASFEAKIGQKRQRKRENKNCRSVPFRSYPTRNREFQENCKKIEKIKKISLWLHLKLKQVGKDREREKIRIVILFRSYPMRNRKFQENCKKIPLWLHFKPKQVGKGREREKIKIVVPFRPVPTRRVIENSKKIIKKLKKLKKYHYGII